MQITIKQEELEAALRVHLKAMGITGAVQEVTFTQSRSEGQLITHIEVGAPDKLAVNDELVTVQKTTSVQTAPRTEPVIPVQDNSAIEIPETSLVEKVEDAWRSSHPKVEAKPAATGQSLFS